MNLLYFLVAEDAIFDGRSNKVSLIKIAELLYLPPSPPQIEGKTGIIWNDIKLVAVANFIRESSDSDEPEFSLRIETPERTVPPMNFPASFGEGTRSRNYVDLPGLPDDGSGEYRIVISYMSEDIELEQYWTIKVVCPDDLEDDDDENEDDILELPEPRK